MRYINVLFLVKPEVFPREGTILAFGFVEYGGS